MGDGTEPRPILDQVTLKRLSVEVSQCTNRRDLDRLTRNTWRTYESSPKNTKALEQLKTRIKAQRDIIARNDPR